MEKLKVLQIDTRGVECSISSFSLVLNFRKLAFFVWMLTKSKMANNKKYSNLNWTWFSSFHGPIGIFFYLFEMTKVTYFLAISFHYHDNSRLVNQLCMHCLPLSKSNVNFYITTRGNAGHFFLVLNFLFFSQFKFKVNFKFIRHVIWVWGVQIFKTRCASSLRSFFFVFISEFL